MKGGLRLGAILVALSLLGLRGSFLDVAIGVFPRSAALEVDVDVEVTVRRRWVDLGILRLVDGGANLAQMRGRGRGGRRGGEES